MSVQFKHVTVSFDNFNQDFYIINDKLSFDLSYRFIPIEKFNDAIKSKEATVKINHELELPIYTSNYVTNGRNKDLAELNLPCNTVKTKTSMFHGNDETTLEELVARSICSSFSDDIKVYKFNGIKLPL